MATDNEVSSIIEDAIREAIAKTDEYIEGDMVIEWGLVVYIANPDPERGDAYPLFFSNGEIPTYRGVGLFQTALKYLNQDLSEE